MIIGHKKQLDFLEKARQNNSLASAYCFLGPVGVGKKTVAEKLAGDLLEVSPDKLMTRPDFLIIGQEKNAKTGKTLKDISVEQIRRVNNFLSQKSWSGGYRVVIIDDAHLLNTAAANAFLKTLESPGEKSIIFLITRAADDLPRTILSRSQIIKFSTVAEHELMEYMGQNLSDSRTKDDIIRWSWGRPGRMSRLLNEQDFLSDMSREEARWQKIINSPFYERLKETEDIFGDPKADHIVSREKLINVIDIWIMLWREVLTGGFPEIQKRYNARGVVEIIDRLREVKIFLRQNIHPRLLVEQSLLSF